MDKDERSFVFFMGALIVLIIILWVWLTVFDGANLGHASEVTIHWTWPSYNADSLDCTQTDTTSILYDLKGARVKGVRIPYPDTLDFGLIPAPSPGVPDSATFILADSVSYVEFIFRTVDVDNNSCCVETHVTRAIPHQDGPRGLTGEYYTYTRWTDFNIYLGTRVDSLIYFNYGAGNAWPGGPADYWSIRWTGKLNIPTTGNWTIYVNSNDGERLWIDGIQLQNAWFDKSSEISSSLDLVKGKHDIKLEYYEGYGNASCSLSWSGPGVAKQIIPRGAFEP